jgi:hypothetical protein
MAAEGGRKESRLFLNSYSARPPSVEIVAASSQKAKRAVQTERPAVTISISATDVAGAANKIHIGKVGTQTGTSIAGISGKTVASGVGVIINSSGQLGTI